MKSNSERHAYWQKMIEEQAQSGLSRREFCERNQIILSQFSYYYVAFKKQEQKNLGGMADVVPIQLRSEITTSKSGEIKVLLPNGLQLSLPCIDSNHLKHWVGVLKSC